MELIFFTIVIFGLMTGSFLNVCIARIPKNESIVFPASHCPLCNHAIAPYDNIPLVSYIILKGRCRSCKEKISSLYPFVEFLTAVLFTAIIASFGLSKISFAYTVLVALLIVATFIDFAHQIIPDRISVGGMIAGVAASLFAPALHGVTAAFGISALAVIYLFAAFAMIIVTFIDFGETKIPEIVFVVFSFLGAGMVLAAPFIFGQPLMASSLYRALLGLVAGGMSIFLLGLFGELIFRKEAMGGGDVKLLAMVGAFLGWKMALLAFFIAPFFGSAVGIVVKLKYKESIIPYGPHLSAAAIIVMFFGGDIIKFLFPYSV